MDLSRRRFLGASGTVAITAGGLLAVTAQPAASVPAAGPTLSAADSAVITRLARLMAVFPMPFPDRGGMRAVEARIGSADLSRLTADFSVTRRQRLRSTVRTLAPHVRSSDEELLAVLAWLEPAPLVPAVALAAHLVADRSDPFRNDGATVWLEAVRRHVGEGGAR